jgi:hypothetical protein
MPIFVKVVSYEDFCKEDLLDLLKKFNNDEFKKIVDAERFDKKLPVGSAKYFIPK